MALSAQPSLRPPVHLEAWQGLGSWSQCYQPGALMSLIGSSAPLQAAAVLKSQCPIRGCQWLPAVILLVKKDKGDPGCMFVVCIPRSQSP